MEDQTPKTTSEAVLDPSVSDTTQADSSNSTVDSLFAIEGLIKNLLEKIENLTLESSRLKEMHNDFLINDPEYSTAEEAAKSAVKAKTAAKKAALAKPEAQSLSAKVKEAKDQLKDFQDSLSNALREYGRLSGSDQLELEPGDIRQIVYRAKLVKSSASHQ